MQSERLGSGTRVSFQFVVILISFAMLAFPDVALVTASTAPTSDNIIPPELIAYISQHPSTTGCVSGTVDPFTITSTECSVSGVANGLSSGSSAEVGVTPNNQYSITCSGICLSGTANSDGSTYYDFWQGEVTAPSNPSNTYTSGSNGPYVSEWIGLSTCVPSCTGYVLQEGISYGADGSSDSHHPGLWVEFLAPSGTCSTSFCGKTMATTAGHKEDFHVQYYPNLNEWLIYALDHTSRGFISYYVPVGTGSGDFPYTTVQYGLVADEGHGVNSAGYWPGAATWDEVLGNSIGGYILGTPSYFAVPSGTSLTSTVTYSTGVCGSLNLACASVGLQVT